MSKPNPKGLQLTPEEKYRIACDAIKMMPAEARKKLHDKCLAELRRRIDRGEYPGTFDKYRFNTALDVDGQLWLSGSLLCNGEVIHEDIPLQKLDIEVEVIGPILGPRRAHLN